MIVTPHVVKEVRAHFKCPTLEGAEIENQGGSGRRYSHLEKRVYENEAMTGVFTNNPVFSRITLALMEDSGWYRANYEMAEDLDWGRNAGCIFAQNSCKAVMDFQLRKNDSISPYCTELPSKGHTHTGCTHNYHGVGICNFVKYETPLPLAYQYFDSLPMMDSPPNYYGGAIILADFCPYYQELNWRKDGVIVRGSNCKHQSNNPGSNKNYALETYGENSVCFLHGRPWKQQSCSHSVTAVDWGSGCYSYECGIDGLVLLISEHSYPCLFDDQILDIKVFNNQLLHEGSIICPPCKVLCGSSCPLVKSSISFHKQSLSNKTQNALVCSLANLHWTSSAIVFYIVLPILVIEINIPQ